MGGHGTWGHGPTWLGIDWAGNWFWVTRAPWPKIGWNNPWGFKIRGTDIVCTSHLGLIGGGGEFSSSHFIFIGQMDALLKGGTMLWTSHLGLIGGGKCSTYHWKILVEWYSLKHVKKVYWGTDIVWSSHLGLIGVRKKAQLIIEGFLWNGILSSTSRKYIAERTLSELAI